MIRSLENLPVEQEIHLMELRTNEELLKKIKLERRKRLEYDKKRNSDLYLDPNTGTWRNKTKTDYSSVGIGEDVKEMSTRKLLNELKDVRYKVDDFEYYFGVKTETSIYNESYALQLRAELSKREHIVTDKKEAKENRRKLAKQKK